MEPGKGSGQYYRLPLTQSSSRRTNTHQLVTGQGRWLYNSVLLSTKAHNCSNVDGLKHITYPQGKDRNSLCFKNCTASIRDPLFPSPVLLALLSSPLISLSPLPCQCSSTKQRVLYLFLLKRSRWSQDLWLSRLHCLVPAVIKVQGSCQPLIRQGQSNPDEGREVATWVEISLILLSLILHFYNHKLTAMHSLFLFFLCAFCSDRILCVRAKLSEFTTKLELLLKRERKKVKVGE